MTKSTGRKTTTDAETQDLSAIPAAALAAELRRRERRVQSLVRRYGQLANQAARLKDEIEALGGSVGRAGPAPSASAPRSRPSNPASLVEALRTVLTGKTMSVGEAAEKVLEAGYRSTSASFRRIVNHTLHISPHFERVARGRYTAR